MKDRYEWDQASLDRLAARAGCHFKVIFYSAIIVVVSLLVYRAIVGW